MSDYCERVCNNKNQKIFEDPCDKNCRENTKVLQEFNDDDLSIEENGNILNNENTLNDIIIRNEDCETKLNKIRNIITNDEKEEQNNNPYIKTRTNTSIKKIEDIKKILNIKKGGKPKSKTKKKKNYKKKTRNKRKTKNKRKRNKRRKTYKKKK